MNISFWRFHELLLSFSPQLDFALIVNFLNLKKLQVNIHADFGSPINKDIFLVSYLAENETAQHHGLFVNGFFRVSATDLG